MQEGWKPSHKSHKLVARMRPWRVVGCWMGFRRRRTSFAWFAPQGYLSGRQQAGALSVLPMLPRCPSPCRRQRLEHHGLCSRRRQRRALRAHQRRAALAAAEQHAVHAVCAAGGLRGCGERQRRQHALAACHLQFQHPQGHRVWVSRVGRACCGASAVCDLRGMGAVGNVAVATSACSRSGSMLLAWQLARMHGSLLACCSHVQRALAFVVLLRCRLSGPLA